MAGVAAALQSSFTAPNLSSESFLGQAFPPSFYPSQVEPQVQPKIEAPIHSSNVMLYSKEKEVMSRVGHKTRDNG